MTEGPKMIRKAWAFAQEKHGGQKDDEGKNYFQAHIKTVHTIIFVIAPNNYDLRAAAILHDTVEDCGVRLHTLIREFGPRVAALVDMVTHRGQKDTTGYYFPSLKPLVRREYDDLYHDAVLLKFADRLSNLSRMGAWDDGRKEHYLRRSKFWKTEIEE